MHGLFKETRRRRQSRHRSPRRHLRNGERAAVIRAMTAAKLYLDQTAPTVVFAATACGSNAHYVRAAVTLMKAENLTLVDRVAKGHVSLLQAARDVKQLAGRVNAYRTATAADHVAFAHVIGPATLFDNAVAPAI
jgi:hypothetical protein